MLDLLTGGLYAISFSEVVKKIKNGKMSQEQGSKLDLLNISRRLVAIISACRTMLRAHYQIG